MLVLRANSRTFPLPKSFICEGWGGEQNEVLTWICSTHTAGIFQTKALKIGKMLTKSSMQLGIKKPCHCHYSKFFVLRKSWQ